MSYLSTAYLTAGIRLSAATMDEAELSVIIFFCAIAITLFICAVIIFVLAVSLVLKGIPLYKMAKNAGMDCPWLAFVPVGNTWIMIRLPKKPFDLFNGKLMFTREAAFLLVILGSQLPAILSYIGNIVTAIPLVGFLICFFMMGLVMACGVFILIFRYYIIEDIFNTYMPNDPNKTVLTVLSLLIPVVFIVILFIHMNDEPDYSYTEYYKAVAARENRLSQNK